MNFKHTGFLGLLIGTLAASTGGCLELETANSGTTGGQGGNGSGGADVGSPSSSSTGQGGGGLGGSSSSGGACSGNMDTSCYPGPAETRSKGACAEGAMTCTAGMWSSCIGSVVPMVEPCDSSVDMNCDGRLGCKGTPESANPLGTAEDDAIYGVAVANGANGFDGAAYGVGYREAITNVDGTPSSAEVLVLKRESTGVSTDWSDRFSITASGNAYAKAVAVSLKENVFVVGVYQNGSLSIDGQGLQSAGPATFSFLASFNPGGKLIFAKSFGTSGTTSINDVDVDSEGNVYIGGSFDASVDFGNGTVVATDASDGFVVSYSNTGVLRWKQIFSGVGTQSVDALSVDALSKLYVATNFTGSLDLSDGTMLPSEGGADGLVTAFSPQSGDILWNNQAGGAGDASITDIAARNGNLAVAVAFHGEIGFGAVNYNNAEPAGVFDALVASLNTAGGAMIADTTFAAPGTQYVRGIDIDSFGDIVTAGFFWEQLPLQGLPTLTTNNSDSNAFIVKFNPSLTPYWAHGYGDAQRQFFLDVAIENTTGHIFTAGAFQGSMSGFGLMPLLSTGGYDALLGMASN